METFTIYFEFSGHKFKHKVIAENKQKAKAKALAELASKINIVKIEKEKDPTIEFFKDIFNLE
jgi:hypothetical protein